jgi:hypothetical protein
MSESLKGASKFLKRTFRISSFGLTRSVLVARCLTSTRNWIVFYFDSHRAKIRANKSLGAFGASFSTSANVI